MFIHTLIEYSCWFTSYAMCSYSMRSFARGNIILGQLDCKMREAMPREQLNCAKGDKAFNVNKLCIYERSSSPLVCIFVTIGSLNLYILHNNGLLSLRTISLPIFSRLPSSLLNLLRSQLILSSHYLRCVQR